MHFNLKAYKQKPERFIYAIYKETGERIQINTKSKWKSEASFLKSFKAHLWKKLIFSYGEKVEEIENTIYYGKFENKCGYKLNGIFFERFHDVAQYISDNFLTFEVVLLKEVKDA